MGEYPPAITDAQKLLVNGCGSSYWLAYIFRVPRWVAPKMAECCDHHDLAYQFGINKETADWELLNCLYYRAYHGSRCLRYIRLCVADVIFWALSTKLSQKCYDKAKG